MSSDSGAPAATDGVTAPRASPVCVTGVAPGRWTGCCGYAHDVDAATVRVSAPAANAARSVECHVGRARAAERRTGGIPHRRLSRPWVAVVRGPGVGSPGRRVTRDPGART